jgi:phosphate-selective porin
MTASSAEVEQLRSEVAAQRQMIEELKNKVQQLLTTNRDAKGDTLSTAVAGVSVSDNSVKLVNASLVPAAAASEKKPATGETPLTAGWNGEHFFIRSPDGNFQIQPTGYLNADYRAYKGDGAPADTFLIRRARFGFQGIYGKHIDYVLLLDAADTNGLTLRDGYVNMKAVPAFQFQVGQFKEPFSEDSLTGDTNLDFVERALTSLLYPSPTGTNRAPGAAVHGDLFDTRVQYWFGAFNGKGLLANNTTNEPEIIGRLRFYPWRAHKGSLLQGLAFGGSVGHGRSRGLSNEVSFSGALPDNAFTFFPQFAINGPVERYNGEFSWTKGPWSLKGEYDQLNQFRNGVGAAQVEGLGFQTLPGVFGQGWYASTTYLLTGEEKPENGIPKVKHPLFGPATPGTEGGKGFGAWEVGFRYSMLRGKELGFSDLNAFTPSLVPTYNDHTNELTFGINWFPNYWVKYSVNFVVDRARDPTVGGVLPQNFFVLLQRLQVRF